MTDPVLKLVQVATPTPACRSTCMWIFQVCARVPQSVVFPCVPLGRRTFSSLQATCAWRLLPRREKVGLLPPALAGANRKAAPDSSSVASEEPRRSSWLRGRARLAAREEDHWEEEGDEEEWAFCDEIGRTWSESTEEVRGELVFWNTEKQVIYQQRFKENYTITAERRCSE